MALKKPWENIKQLRFENVIAGPCLKNTLPITGIAVGCDHNHRSLMPAVSEGIKTGKPIHHGHHQIQKDQINALLLQQLNQSGSVIAQQGRYTEILEFFFQQRANSRIVVHDGNRRLAGLWENLQHSAEVKQLLTTTILAQASEWGSDLKNGSPEIRTQDQPVKSRMLYR